MLGDDTQAEDVTQEVFLHIQRSIASYDPERPLSPWVFTIATNQVRDHWRAARRVDPLDGPSLDDEEARPDPPAREMGPLPVLEQAELSRTLGAAIDALPESLRTTLLLRYQEGLTFEEIAKLVSRNETAVRKRYSRALEQLRERLSSPSARFAEGGLA
jgi:RNA polymerase sigma-70 factor (ECF subfamily)